MEQGNSFGEEAMSTVTVGCATFLLCFSFNYASDIFLNFAHVSIGTSEFSRARPQTCKGVIGGRRMSNRGHHNSVDRGRIRGGSRS
jgi:hypothetical protein